MKSRLSISQKNEDKRHRWGEVIKNKEEIYNTQHKKIKESLLKQNKMDREREKKFREDKKKHIS